MVVRSFFRYSETQPFTCCDHTHCQAALARIFIGVRNEASFVTRVHFDLNQAKMHPKKFARA